MPEQVAYMALTILNNIRRIPARSLCYVRPVVSCLHTYPASYCAYPPHPSSRGTPLPAPPPTLELGRHKYCACVRPTSEITAAADPDPKIPCTLCIPKVHPRIRTYIRYCVKLERGRYEGREGRERRLDQLAVPTTAISSRGSKVTPVWPGRFVPAPPLTPLTLPSVCILHSMYVGAHSTFGAGL